MFRSIRLTATLLVCGLLVAVITVYAAATYQALKRSALASARSRLVGISTELASTLAGSSQRMMAEASGLAAEPRVIEYLRSGSTATTEVTVILRSPDTPGAAGANIVGTELRDVSGRRLLDTHASRSREREVAGRVAHEVARRADSVAIVPFHAVGDSVLYGAVAVVRAEGRRLGYLIRWRRLATSRESLELIRDLIGSDARVYLANRSGDVWTDLNHPIPPRIRALPELREATTFERPEGEEALLAGVPVAGTPWIVMAELPVARVLADARETMRALIALGLVVLAAAALVAWALVGRLTRTIRELADAAQAIRLGDYSRRTSVRRANEIGTLSRAFNAMASNIEAAKGELEQKMSALAAAERENREIRERLENVLASSSAILYECRIEGETIELAWISGNVERLLGYRAEEALAPGWWWRCLHPDDRHRFERSLEGLAVEGLSFREYRFLHADGEYRWIRDDQRLLRDENRRPSAIVGFMVDVTERHGLESAKAYAEAANSAKNQFLSRMSHELRTPLNAILGFGQLLELETEGEDNRESVQQILGAGRHLLALIDEVLDIARIEAGKMTIRAEPVAVRDVLGESVDLVRISAARRGIDVRVGTDPGAPGFVSADPRRLKQVMLNLLSNGVKYNRPDGVLTVSCRESRPGHARIGVKDTGPGFTPEQLERLFTPFDRLGAERAQTEGTGLGLAISRALVEAMGGEMGVETVRGEGSEFWVELPIAHPKEGEVDLAAPLDRPAGAVAPADR